MELLPLLQAIWRRRLALGAGLLVAAAVLVGLGGTKSVTARSGVAWTRVELDTRKSQLVDASPKGADTLGWRASLMSHLMATDSSTAAVARRLGVPADEVTDVDPTLVQPLVPTDTAEAATRAAGSVFTPYVLVAYADGQLPVISIEAVAANTTAAKRLAAAAVGVLGSESSRGGPLRTLIPSGVGVTGIQSFIVSQVVPIRAQVISSSSLPTKALGGALVVFVLWCVSVTVVLPRISGRLRLRGAARPA